jgi:hypothetical protein
VSIGVLSREEMPNKSASPTPNCGSRFAPGRSLARAAVDVMHETRFPKSMDESAYLNRVIRLLESDFKLEREARGEWPNGGSVFADLLCRPRPHIVEAGFSPQLFLVEVKSPECKESVKRLLDAILQSFTYSLSKFEGRQPDFGLLYPPIVSFFEWDRAHKYADQPNNAYQPGEARILGRLIQRGNVGEIHERQGSYEFRFGGSFFFSPAKGQTKEKNLGTVRRVGSRKRRA